MKINIEAFLFKLIKSLSPLEKKYFKEQFIHSDSSDVPAYFQIFLLLEKHDDEEYDRKRIEAEYTKAGYKNFSASSYYLYNSLTNILSTHYFSKDVEYKIEMKLKIARYLAYKGFIDESKNITTNLKSIANDYDLHLKMQEIDNLELGFIRRIENKSIKKQQDDIIEHQIEIVESYLHVLKLKKLYYHLFSLSFIENRSNEESSHTLNEIFSQIQLLSEQSEASNSFHVQYYYLSSLHFYYRLKRDFLKSLDYNLELVKLWEKHNKIIEQNPSRYLTTLWNYLGNCLESNKYTDWTYSINKILHIYNFTGFDKQFTSINLLYYQIHVLLKRGDITQAFQLLDDVNYEKNIFSDLVKTKYKDKYLSFMLLVAVLYFYANDSKNALKYVNTILNYEFKSEQKLFVVFSARLFRIILTFELGDMFLIEEMCNSTKIFFKRHNKLDFVETSFLHFFKKNTFANKTEFKDELIELKNSLKETDESQLYNSVGFNWIDWIDCKLENKTMYTIANLRAKNEFPEIFSVVPEINKMHI